jgi:hypothetical protein
MIEIGHTLISRDVLEKYFTCNLSECKGACCIEGDSGAPLTPEEAKIIEQEYPLIKNYLPLKHQREIEKHGFSVIDSDGDLVTPLVNNRQCAYSYYNDKGILRCSIERLYSEGKTSFIKPLSCHLFPIRIKEYENFDAVNYEELDICKPGRILGELNHTRLYQFLKEPLIRKYGKEWYQELEIAAHYLDSKKNIH